MAAISLQWPSLMEAGLPTPPAISASVVTLVLILAARSAYTSDIKYFLLSQQNLAAQKRNIELNIEFTDRIKSFIPGEIARRLEALLSERDVTVLQAIDEVLRPRKKNICCLFSDIRGFTEASKDVDAFVGNMVIPNVKDCTLAIDQHRGIPRKIGDLVFAYFDDDNALQNLTRCLAAAIEISKINRSTNEANGEQNLSRYILLSCGDALVGNIGGFDSSVEITALGSPVNFLSRVDEVTKTETLAGLLRSGDIIMSEEFYESVSNIVNLSRAEHLHLPTLGESLRNFPETENLYLLRPTKLNPSDLEQIANIENENDRSNWNQGAGQAA